MSRLKSRKRLVRLVVVLGCLLLSGVVLAQVSTNFDLGWHLLSGGGGSRGSDNYQIDDSLGQWAGGTTGSTNYDLDPGFWYGAAAEPAPCLVGLADVSISGAATGYTDTVYVMVATASPTSATLPVNYVWSSDGLVSGQGTDSATYQWAAPDVYHLTLTTENCGGLAGDTFDFTVALGEYHVYLPVVQRRVP